ncbi:MAG: glycoside hydrolase, partial [Acidobacteria bacterium]|nr:glycoside hydrolase [Acidobacteriota bacterium]
PAVTKPELERELRAMKDAGIGGVELQPVYPLALDDPDKGFHNAPYLSNEFLDDVRFAAEKARELGLRFDVTLGSGWPYGGPHVPITQAAGRLRIASAAAGPGETSVAAPSLAGGETLIAAFAGAASHTAAPAEMLSLDQIRGGRLSVPASDNTQAITFFISSRTGMQVKRPSIGAEGFVVDHFDRAAIENHLHTVGDRLLSAFESHPPFAVFSDSLEVYGSDWTSGLLEEFKRRRGYDLAPYLPALAGDMVPETSEIRHDWGETLTELVDERYLSPVREWAHEHGTRFRAQVYGIPAVSLSSNALVDLPEGEGDNWRGFSPSRWASSAGHLYRKDVISAETWTWLHSPAFRATPLDMKADADRFFLEGINQIVGHGWPYSPAGIPEPGWSFYAAGAFNDHNPWWPVMPELTSYLGRISYLLRQGEPANDVALLLPADDAWAQFAPGKVSLSEAVGRMLGRNVIGQILDAGFNFDFIDAQAIGKNGIPYPVLVLPDIRRIPLAVYRRIEQYAGGGGIVVATKHAPSRAPGFKDADKDSPGVGEISRRLFEDPGARGILVGDEDHLARALVEHLKPDMSLSQETGDLGFVHRRLSFADIYFIANTSNRDIAATADFRTTRRNGEWWDAFSGRFLPAGGASGIPLTLPAYASRVLVFTDGTPMASTQAAELEPRPAKASLVDLTRNWSVTWPGLGRTLRVENLDSWTGDGEARFYSGSRVYKKEFVFEAPVAKRAYLDFGQGVPIDSFDKHSRFFAGLDPPVRDAAEVFVNEHSAGLVWKPPYRLEITPLLRRGTNQLRIVVYNTAVNELAGRALPDYRLLDLRYGERFMPQDVDDWKPLPSGLVRAPQLQITDE